MLRWIISIVLIFFAFVTATSLYLQPNDFVGCSDQPSGHGKCVPADAIVAIRPRDAASAVSLLRCVLPYRWERWPQWQVGTPE